MCWGTFHLDRPPQGGGYSYRSFLTQLTTERKLPYRSQAQQRVTDNNSALLQYRRRPPHYPD